MGSRPFANRRSREYAVENKCFSQKIDGGYYTPEGKFLSVPIGITRDEKLPYWRCVNRVTKKMILIKDSDHGGDFEKSLYAAKIRSREK